jgi:serine protease Do
VYTIQLIGGNTYQIDMQSTALDSYLRLEDSTQFQLASDDDSGGDRNARIVFSCLYTGTYRIIATTYLAGATGNFTLKVLKK